MAHKALTRSALIVAYLTASAFQAAAENRWVTIYNDTGYDIIRFYSSHRDARTWEEDILGRNILPSGNRAQINFDDGSGYCIFDFKAVFEDGDVLVRRGVNVCELGSYVYR